MFSRIMRLQELIKHEVRMPLKSTTNYLGTDVPTNSDSDVCFVYNCCTHHLSYRVSIDGLCINPTLRIGLIHK